jgi:hypothetical protein
MKLCQHKASTHVKVIFILFFLPKMNDFEMLSVVGIRAGGPVYKVYYVWLGDIKQRED